jgi:hypothetical protein
MATEQTSPPAASGRKIRAAVILALMLAIAFGVCIFRGPIIFQTDLTRNIACISDPPLTLFNPLRARGPEIVADDFLKQLQAGHVEVIPKTEDPSDVEWHRTREREYPLSDWSLGDREDLKGKVVLTYWVRRRSPPYDGYPPVFLQLAPRGNGWEVTGFNAGY